jgi:hypothetical protein
MDRGKELLEEALNRSAKEEARKQLAFEQQVQALARQANIAISSIENGVATSEIPLTHSTKYVYILPWATPLWKFICISKFSHTSAEQFGDEVLAGLLISNSQCRVGHWCLKDIEGQGITLTQEHNTNPEELSSTRFKEICLDLARMVEQVETDKEVIIR